MNGETARTGHPDRRRRLGRPDRGARASRRARPDLVDRSGRREAAGCAASATSAPRRSPLRRKRMLEQLGIWQKIEAEAQPILSMEITDSRTGDAVAPDLPDLRRQRRGGRAVRAHGGERAADRGAARGGARGGDQRSPRRTRSKTFCRERRGWRSALPRARARRAALLVAADGIRSKLRAQAGIKTVTWSYPQTAIVATVSHERPHNGVAVEHFLPGRAVRHPAAQGQPLVARLDRAQGRCRAADRRATTSSSRSSSNGASGIGSARSTLDGGRAAYPLGLILARDFVRPRFALLGDAAHGIHPIAGQGLNLGFRDAAALAETIVDADRLGLDIGALEVLRRYEQWRRYDTFQMGVTTDLLNRLFSNDISPLRALRDIGLGIVDRLPRLKKLFIGEAAGLGRRAAEALEGRGDLAPLGLRPVLNPELRHATELAHVVRRKNEVRCEGVRRDPEIVVALPDPLRTATPGSCHTLRPRPSAAGGPEPRRRIPAASLVRRLCSGRVRRRREARRRLRRRAPPHLGFGRVLTGIPSGDSAARSIDVCIATKSARIRRKNLSPSSVAALSVAHAEHFCNNPSRPASPPPSNRVAAGEPPACVRARRCLPPRDEESDGVLFRCPHDSEEECAGPVNLSSPTTSTSCCTRTRSCTPASKRSANVFEGQRTLIEPRGPLRLSHSSIRRASSSRRIGMPSRIGNARRAAWLISSCRSRSYSSVVLVIGQTRISRSFGSTGACRSGVSRSGHRCSVIAAARTARWRRRAPSR